MKSKDPGWFNDDMPLGRPMGIITKSYYGALSKRIEQLGIDRHFTTLVVIHGSPEKCTQQCLSNILSIDKVSMVRILDYLVEKKMITRVINPEDRREHIIQLTALAKKRMPDILNEIAAMNAIALNGLNKAEKRVFEKAIAIVIGNLEDLPANKVDIKLKKK
jgi:DNA-binding MarR family transcriptional regulator